MGSSAKRWCLKPPDCKEALGKWTEGERVLPEAPAETREEGGRVKKDKEETSIWRIRRGMWGQKEAGFFFQMGKSEHLRMLTLRLHRRGAATAAGAMLRGRRQGLAGHQGRAAAVTGQTFHPEEQEGHQAHRHKGLRVSKCSSAGEHLNDLQVIKAAK